MPDVPNSFTVGHVNKISKTIDIRKIIVGHWTVSVLACRYVCCSQWSFSQVVVVFLNYWTSRLEISSYK